MADSFRTPPQLPPNFDWTPETIMAETRSIIENTHKLQNELVNSLAGQEVSFQNFVVPQAQHENETTDLKRMFKFLSTVAPSAALRDACNASEKLFSEFAAQSLMRDDLFQLIEKVYRQKEDIDEESLLYLQFKRRDFIHNGFGINTEAKRNHYVDIRKQIQVMEIEYRKTLNIDSGLWFSREDLDGLPLHVLDGLRVDEETESLWYPLKKPHLNLGLKYAKKESTRQKIYVGNDNRCIDNVARLKEIVLLRDEAARLLGYQNHAEFKMEEKMAESTEFVNEFLADLKTKLAPLAKLEIQRLLELKYANFQDPKHALEMEENTTSKKDTKLYAWDLNYCTNLARIKDHSFDEKTFSEYFSLERTLAGMLSVYTRVFGLRFSKIEKSDYSKFGPDHVMTWHEDVLVYTVWNDNDIEGGDFLGYLYLDLFPRDKKYNHAGHNAFLSGYETKSGKRHYPASAVVMNFAKPQANKPTLLAHDDIRSLFHELGHAMHSFSSRTKYAIFHGPSKPGGARDFVEIPSIMLENWWWTPAVIKDLGYHYSYISDDFRLYWEKSHEEAVTNFPSKTLTDDIIENLLNTRFSSEALSTLRQCHFAIFDMAIHSPATHKELEKTNLSELWNKSMVEISLLNGLESEGWEWGHGFSRFGAIGKSYDAGYFAYALGQVYAQDMFKTMFEKDPMSRVMGMRFRKTVLAPGGSCNGMRMIKNFLERAPNAEARSRELGLQ